VELYEARLGPDHVRTAGALKTLAGIEAFGGNDHDAEPLYRRALAIDERVLGSDNATVAGDLVTLAPILQRSGKRQEAEIDLIHALATLTTQFGDDSPMALGAIVALADKASGEARYGEARELADRAQTIRERTLGPDNPSLIGSLIFAERLDIATGRLEIAGTEIDRAAAIADKMLHREHPFYIDVFAGKADLAAARGDLTKAEQDNRQALALAANLFALDHPARQGASDRVVNALWANGKFAEAEQLRRDQLAELGRVHEDGHPSIARALRNLAAVLANSARANDAITLYERALTIDEQAFGSGSRKAGMDHLALGSILTASGRFDQARLELNHARTIAESETDRSLLIGSLNQLVGLAEVRTDYAEALVHGERMIDVAGQVFGSDSPALAAQLALLGKLYLVTGRVENAAEIVARIKRSVGEDPPQQSPGYFDVLQLQAMLAAERNNVPRAEPYLKRAIAFATKYGGPQAGNVGLIEYNLAVVYLRAQRFSEALANFTAALAIWKRQSGDHAPIVGYTLMGAAKAYAGLGDKAKSEALAAAAIEILGPIIASRPEPEWL
jgi:tetratricopeptide (TPR) repeat protein